MGTSADGRLLRGAQTRREILRHATAIASVEGLEGLSIGRLATELGISKSGVFAHFGAKEELQLATVQTAREIFREQVVEPGLAVPPGVGRLWRICDAWLTYSQGHVFPGGCFFMTVSAEFNTRPGRVRDEIAASLLAWRHRTEETIDDARALGELVGTTDARQLAFELSAYEAAANAESLLHDDVTAYDRARRAMLDRLAALATDTGRPALPPRP